MYNLNQTWLSSAVVPKKGVGLHRGRVGTTGAKYISISILPFLVYRGITALICEFINI